MITDTLASQSFLLLRKAFEKLCGRPQAQLVHGTGDQDLVREVSRLAKSGK